MTETNTNPQAEKLAAGGGNATAAGVIFQSGVGALFAVDMLTQRALDHRLELGAARPVAVRFESEAPVDDILVETTAGGWIFVQCKTTMTLSRSLESPLGKTADEIVRLWQICESDSPSYGWDRPLDPARDRIVVAVGAAASSSVREALAGALAAVRAPSAAPLTQIAYEALDALRNLLTLAWSRVTGSSPSTGQVEAILRLVWVVEFDLPGGAQSAAIEALRGTLQNPETASATWSAIQSQCAVLMSARRGTDEFDLKRRLGVSVAFLAPPDFREDVRVVRQRSDEVRDDLARFEETRVHGASIQVPRACTDAVVAAARDGSLVIVGDPGAGKSGVINSAAAALRAEGHDVIELAVDRLPVDSLGELRTQLGLEHSFREVLANWPGAQTGYLFIDALDATRGGQSEAVFRAVIAEVLGMSDRRWHVIASIRTFDLMLGEQFRRLFAGAPPSPQFASPSFGRVRHIQIPEWSDTEFAELLRQAPDLRTAIEHGGERLRNLARVPFNTRLLADLLSGGMAPEAFGELASQVELLGLYWQERVVRLGTPAERCLRRTVELMVQRGRLQANRIEASRDTGSAIDELRQANVLVDVGDRDASFRHHILFDYAASRVFIDPDDIAATASLLRANPALGLMLGPALAFALQGLWASSAPGRSEFWDAIIELAGNTAADAVGRSVAARCGSELPRTVGDIEQFAAMIAANDSRRSNTAAAFANVVGALAVRAEDKLTIALSPWCRLAALISQVRQEVAWPLRTLLHLLLGREPAGPDLNEAGTAARALLAYAVREPNAQTLVASAIGFVGSTYPTNPVASREALAALLDPVRLAEHAHEDMHWLTRETAHIAPYDAAFVVRLFATVFGHEVGDEQQTSLGNSRILPLSSTRRQDYDMARWSLKEAFPDFIASHPAEGVRAMIAAIAGYIAQGRHSTSGTEAVRIEAGGASITFQEDMSHIWAWDPTDAHSNNAIALVNAYAKFLAAAPADKAARLVEAVMQENTTALIWARTFQGAAKRADDAASALRPWAVQPPFLISLDTRKDAVDFIANGYGTWPVGERAEFERDVLALKRPDVKDPAEWQNHIRRVIFGTIGESALASENARAYARPTSEGVEQPSNERAFAIRSYSRGVDDHWWLLDRGVDVDAEPNASVLEQIDAATTIAPGDLDAATLHALSEALAGLVAALETTPADPLVIDQGWRRAASACERLSQQSEILRQLPDDVTRLASIVSRLLALPVEAADADDQGQVSLGGIESEALEAALNLALLDRSTAERFLPALHDRAGVPRASARLAVMSRLNQLWNSAREDMWCIAEARAAAESNHEVLRFLLGFLNRLVHADPVRVEAIALTLLQRGVLANTDPSREIEGAAGTLFAILWVSHGREQSHAVLDRWLEAPAGHRDEFCEIAFAIRGGLVLGYDKEDAADDLVRHRCQALAARIIDVTASQLDAYLATPADQVPADGPDRAGVLAQIMDRMSDQFYFASGAMAERDRSESTGLSTPDLRRRFFDENQATFRRVGTSGTPHTIYHLIELLDFLSDADPPAIFDLVAHALLVGGRRHGFHFESLGADRFVKVIGRFLADYRPLFEAPDRRSQIVECLNVFAEAGWPAARRLLFQLPELLR
ncbi:hypothetical protein NVS89_09380 [Ancylobacter sp. MQZ15Z-1]|uniref:Uncharacterized protein n=1 Tax=Ancylobacter mangrovi TaxID=2972472 RepID=A0A9X2T5D0_9HYPH|nr:hypothetical protein [Ancylobacter mangrovi]MCS0495309.1 hypothetical protein [Ancylobacter mangrovi]